MILVNVSILYLLEFSGGIKGELARNGLKVLESRETWRSDQSYYELVKSMNCQQEMLSNRNKIAYT